MSKQPPMFEDDNQFNSFVAWTGVWMMTSPHPKRFNPNVVAEKILIFLKSVLSDNPSSEDMMEEMISGHISDEDLSLINFYVDQYLPTLRELDGMKLTAARFASLLKTAVEFGSGLMAMHALVQTLFWRVHEVLGRDLDVDLNLAMKTHYQDFISASRVLATRLGIVA